jgi:hypothetical protein
MHTCMLHPVVLDSVSSDISPARHGRGETGRAAGQNRGREVGSLALDLMVVCTQPGAKILSDARGVLLPGAQPLPAGSHNGPHHRACDQVLRPEYTRTGRRFRSRILALSSRAHLPLFLLPGRHIWRRRPLPSLPVQQLSDPVCFSDRPGKLSAANVCRARAPGVDPPVPGLFPAGARAVKHPVHAFVGGLYQGYILLVSNPGRYSSVHRPQSGPYAQGL